MKKRFVVAITLVLFLLSTSLVFAEYWGSKKSNKYHSPTCRWAQKISSKNLIKFNTPESAIKAGYVPCKVCKPPTSSRSDATTGQNVLAKFPPQGELQRRGYCFHHWGIYR